MATVIGRRAVGLIAAATALALAAGGATVLLVRADLGGGASAATIARGRAIYAERCASCHGAALEGQPDWKRPLASGRMPAPPHDASGHTWHHADRILVAIVRDGPAAVVGGGYRSDMPAFGTVLGDDEIGAVLAFIKSTWPERERGFQDQVSRRDEPPRDERAPVSGGEPAR